MKNNQEIQKTEIIKSLEVSTTNILFKTEEEQFEIMTNFSKMLDSLKFPIQILFNTSPYNLKSKKLKIKNNEYDKFLKSIVKKNKLMERNFRIVLSYNDEDILDSSIEVIKRYLKRCSLLCTEVKTIKPQEYIPDEFSKNHCKFGDYYTRTFYISDFPYSSYCGWLNNIYNSNLNMDISMNIQPIENFHALKYLDHKLAARSADSMIKEDQNKFNDCYDEIIVSALRMRQEIFQNRGKLYFISMYMTIKSKNLVDLIHDTEILKGILASMGITVNSCYLRQDDGYRSTQPISNDILNKKYNITTQSLKYFFPFISSNIMDKDGVLIGDNLLSPGLIFLNPFIYNSALMFVLGKVGGGKTYLIQLLVLRLLYMGVQIDIWDKTGFEYQNILKLTNLPNIKVHTYSTMEEYEEEMIRYLDEMKGNINILNQRMLIMDEGWQFLHSDIISQGINEISLTGRKFYQGLCFITQMVEHLQDEKILSVLRQASIKAIMQTELNSAKVLQKELNLTDSEVRFLVSAYQEGILFAGGRHVQFKALASEKEDKIITTDPSKRIINLNSKKKEVI